MLQLAYFDPAIAFNNYLLLIAPSECSSSWSGYGHTRETNSTAHEVDLFCLDTVLEGIP